MSLRSTKNLEKIWTVSGSLNQEREITDILFSNFQSLCRLKFSFEAYTENIREKATKFSLKITDVLLDAGRDLFKVLLTL